MPRRRQSLRPSRRRSVVACSALGLAMLVTSCTADRGLPDPPPDAPTPEQVVAGLAAGLAKRDVAAVAFASTTGAEVNAQLAPLVAGMGTLRPTVTVRSVDAQGDRASGTLTHTWTFPGVAQPWSYDSTAQLVREDGSWKATWQPSLVHPDLNAGNRLSERREAAPRGEVLGADGDAIVTARPVVRIGIDKTKLAADRVPASAKRLAALVDIDPAGYAAKVAAAGAADYVEAIVLREDDGERPSNKEIYAIPGAVPMGVDQMLAPSRDFARQILGTVGPATKELVEDSQGAVTAGDQVGRAGLQRRYDQELRGTPGVVVRLVTRPTPSPSPPTGSSVSAAPSVTPTPSVTPAPPVTLFESKPVPGKDLNLTLSIPLQELAEKTLAETKPAAALVAIQPSTGRVLAAANGRGSGDQSIATVGTYAPGSTFKVVTSLALLRAGLTPDSPVNCPATLTVDGKRFKNYSDYPSSQQGRIDLETALAHSCNTAFLGQRSELSGSDLSEAAASLGLGTDYDVGFASFFGSVPADPSATGRAAALIGQGRVLASPMAMAAVTASVAAGRTVVPTLVEGRTAKPTAKPLTAEEAADLREMMGAVVSEGSGRVLGDVGGPALIAKTGTAEYGPKAPFKTHAWMIAAQEDLAVAVFVQTGASGSRTAGPLLARFLAGAR